MAHPVDQLVGRNIRYRRWLLGMTQQELAKRAGIKFQQIQKYETGKNRVSASRLWLIAQAQSAEIQYYFEGVESNSVVNSLQGAITPSFSIDKTALEFAKIIHEVPAKKKKMLIELAKSMSN